jgi:hypothetical protein
VLLAVVAVDANEEEVEVVVVEAALEAAVVAEDMGVEDALTGIIR